MIGNITIDGKQNKIVCFLNGKKEEEKHPDWLILISKPPVERPQFGFTDTTGVAEKGFIDPLEEERINPKDIPF